MKKLITLLFTIIITYSAHAQISNPSFENWDASAGYNVPVGWKTADSVTNLVGVLTCEQGTPGFSGSYYLKLTSKNIPATSGAAAGIAVSGNIDFTTYLPTSGFAFSGRPSSLTGEWQYASSAANDSGVIAIGLTKWNSSLQKRDTVGYADYKLTGSVTTWTPFSVPIYYLTGEYPDTAIIYLASSGVNAANGSYLYIDTLAFSGSVPTGVASINNTHPLISLYPNPNSSLFTVNISSDVTEMTQIIITNMFGDKVKEITTSTNTSVDIQLNESAGIYFINATTAHAKLSEKITIIK